MPRLKLVFCYDGTHFHGWQRQKNTANTIQEILESKLSMVASNTRVSVVASGRTDAGVHARVQVAHADVPDAVVDMARAGRLLPGLNSLLPPDMRVLSVEPAVAGFHAQDGVERKTYVYFIDPRPLQAPELRDHAWHLRLPLDWDAIEQATLPLVGRHDFKAFCASDSSAATTERTIYEAAWGPVRWRGIGAAYDLMALRLTGSGFLKSMVRSIVGTLVHVGGGKSSPDVVARALTSRERALAGPTAPARGLWLWDILYR